MARGNTIIVSCGDSPKGVFVEGVVGVGQTFYPGMIVQRDATVALKSGRASYTVFNRDADGDHPAGALWVVTGMLSALQGKSLTDSIAAGERVQLYCPIAGEELNLLVGDVAGTGDDHSAGEILMVDDGTGKLIATTGSPEVEVALLLETITDPTADTLAWCEWAY